MGIYSLIYRYKTIVMGASFRNIGEIEELTGCDYLTISPSLLKELEGSSKIFTPRLTLDKAKATEGGKITMNEKIFRYQMNEDAMVHSLVISRQPKNCLKEFETLPLTALSWRRCSKQSYNKVSERSKISCKFDVDEKLSHP